MIVRAWRGYASLEKPEDYPDHFRRNVVPELKGIDGFLGARLMRSQTLEGFEFLVHTRWRSMDAIRALRAMTSSAPWLSRKLFVR